MSKQFSALGISTPLLQMITELKIVEPTEIQQKVIPQMLSTPNDVVGLAQTGTGKTLAFGLPILQLIEVQNPSIQAVVLVPTRELGHQIQTHLEQFSKDIKGLTIAVTCGGVPIKPQIEQLKLPTQIVVATPGRLIDLLQRQAIDLKQTRFLVVDEADEMVSILKESLDEIVAALPKSHRTFLFSATLSGPIKQLVQQYLSKNAVTFNLATEIRVNNGIQHQYIVVDPIEKLDVLMHFLTSREGERGIIFCKTKAAVNKLAKNLAINKFSSGAIHGSLTQGIRDRIMGQFRDGHLQVLIATDLASRGIDVPEMAFVVHYHLPDTLEAYVHRSGRTARAGSKGLSLSIIQSDELEELSLFQKELNFIFEDYKKPSIASREENNTLLWAKKVFKTKPNHELDSDFKARFKTVFHHLTKEELIEKLLAFQMQQNGNKKEIASKKTK